MTVDALLDVIRDRADMDARAGWKPPYGVVLPLALYALLSPADKLALKREGINVVQAKV